MNRLEPEIIDYYNNEVVMMIVEKYGLSQMEALKMFVEESFNNAKDFFKKEDFLPLKKIKLPRNINCSIISSIKNLITIFCDFIKGFYFFSYESLFIRMFFHEEKVFF